MREGIHHHHQLTWTARARGWRRPQSGAASTRGGRYGVKVSQASTGKDGKGVEWDQFSQMDGWDGRDGAPIDVSNLEDRMGRHCSPPHRLASTLNSPCSTQKQHRTGGGPDGRWTDHQRGQPAARASSASFSSCSCWQGSGSCRASRPKQIRPRSRPRSNGCLRGLIRRSPFGMRTSVAQMHPISLTSRRATGSSCASTYAPVTKRNDAGEGTTKHVSMLSESASCAARHVHCPLTRCHRLLPAPTNTRTARH